MKLRPNFILGASGSVVLILPPGRAGRREGVGWTAEAPAVLHHPTGAVGLVGTVRLVLGAPVLDEPAVADLKPLLAFLGNRLRLRRSLGVEAPFCLPQPGPPPAAACQLPGQLIAPRRAVALVLGGVDARRLGQHLGGDLLVAADRRVGRGGT